MVSKWLINLLCAETLCCQMDGFVCTHGPCRSSCVFVFRHNVRIMKGIYKKFLDIQLGSTKANKIIQLVRI